MSNSSDHSIDSRTLTSSFSSATLNGASSYPLVSNTTSLIPYLPIVESLSATLHTSQLNLSSNTSGPDLPNLSSPHTSNVFLLDIFSIIHEIENNSHSYAFSFGHTNKHLMVTKSKVGVFKL